MLKKLFPTIFLFLSLITVGFGFTGSGNGTQISPYLITDCHELNETRDDLMGWYELSENVNCNVSPYNVNEGFEPIGEGNNPHGFEGNFNGGGFEIQNLYINRNESDYVALFGGMLAGSEVYNFTLTNLYIKGNNNVGGVVGENIQGSIYQVISYGVIIGNDKVGGIAGENTQGDIYNVENYGSVSGNENVGGVVGSLTSGDIYDLANNGNIFGLNNIGGIVGENLEGLVYSSISYGLINGSFNVGGAIGYNKADIRDIEVNSEILGSNNVGGIVGKNEGGFIFKVLSISNISGDGNIGGIVGENINGILNITNSSSIIDGSNNLGGIVGKNVNSKIYESYISVGISIISANNVGTIIGENINSNLDGFKIRNNVQGNNNVGGIVGKNTNSNITNSYFIGNVLGFSGVGGVIGVNIMSNIDNTFFNGLVNGSEYVGGVVGLNENSYIFNSFVVGDITGTSSVGGIVGETNSDIRFVYHNGFIIGNSLIGGLVGENKGGKIINSFTVSDVDGDSNFDLLVGKNSSTDTYENLSYQNVSFNSNSSFGDGVNNDMNYFFSESYIPLNLFDDNIWTFYEDKLPDFGMYIESIVIQDLVDSDNDGTPDNLDKLIGNINSINLGAGVQIKLKINGTEDITGNHLNYKTLNFEDILGNKVLDLNKNFSVNKLNMSNITISKISNLSENVLFLKGFDLQIGEYKNVYFNLNVNELYFNDNLCIVDEELDSISGVGVCGDNITEFLFENISQLGENNWTNISYINISWSNYNDKIIKIVGLNNSVVFQNYTGYVSPPENNIISTGSSNSGGEGSSGFVSYSNVCVSPQIEIDGNCIYLGEVLKYEYSDNEISDEINKKYEIFAKEDSVTEEDKKYIKLEPELENEKGSNVKIIVGVILLISVVIYVWFRKEKKILEYSNGGFEK
ncbi:MAG: hypothetical protein HRU03_04235 [Nanoarchaeales archaeon]|nr:hypothetical protein [Nanoarchaeales archaeon]